MLCEARKKSSKLELQIEWVEQDCTKFNLNVKSNLIFSVGKSFQHFLSNEEQDGLLSSVNKHLEMERRDLEIYYLHLDWKLKIRSSNI